MHIKNVEIEAPGERECSDTGIIEQGNVKTNFIGQGDVQTKRFMW